MSESSILQKLKEISFFNNVPEHDLKEIAAITHSRDYKPGDIIIEENSKAETFFIIYHGKIEVLKRFDDEEEVVLGVYSNGEIFGEMAVFNEGLRSASAKAVESTTVMEVPYKDFERVLQVAPQIAYAIMKELSARLRQTSALLVWQLNRKNKELEEASFNTVRTVINTLEEKSSFFTGHSERVSQTAMGIGRILQLEEQEIKHLELGGLLHDVGMIGISESILLKKEPLGDGEFTQIREHPLRTSEMLKHIIYLKPVIPHVLYHHERYDGSGYPESLSGSDIPLGSRIIAVAEVFDALTHARPYRKAMNTDAAVEKIKTMAGKNFDPKVVSAFLSYLNN